MARHPWVTDGPGTRIYDACGARQQRTSAGIWQPDYAPDCPNLSDDGDNPPGDRPPPVKPLPSDPDYDPHPKPDARDVEELVA
jgi:hypothetical protein